MQVIREQTDYIVKISAEDLKDMWWFFNDYLIENPFRYEDNETKWDVAKKYTDSFKFVVSK
ncbi:hypothetical protein [Paenibacillus naphthalenovorans]|uniref:Uncharacterized protein n=1 Tax=Paenibacillus naphthalenovorans TaxID=162209 RepID=A0A0U2U7J1_9BACL|nr:hypothetical protein [Paenibacillus naphthalenovorans]ALS22152.1 hypothetical protein IJ22_17780 [Paenibacillus naphthalenovorans]